MKISISPQRITKNRQKSPFLHGELQKTDGNLHFFTENYKKPTEISISSRRICSNHLWRPFLTLEIPIHQRKDRIFYFFLKTWN